MTINVNSLDATTSRQITEYAEVVGKTPQQVISKAFSIYMEMYGDEIMHRLLQDRKRLLEKTVKKSQKKSQPKVTCRKPTCISSAPGFMYGETPDGTTAEIIASGTC